jgi:hypothetical protein
MNRQDELARALDAGLAAIKAGQSPHEVLARFPAVRDEAERMLAVAALLSAAPAVGPSPAFRASLRARLVATARASEEQRASGLLGLLRWPAPLARWPSMVAAMVVAAALLGNVTMTASASALPGELLYPVKRLAERAELTLVGDEDARRSLQFRHAEERLRETEALARRGESGRAAEAAADYAAAVEALRPVAAGPDQDTLEEDLASRLVEHQERLRMVLRAAPEAARPGLVRAVERSSSGLERAVEAPARPESTPTPVGEDGGEREPRGPAPAPLLAEPGRRAEAEAPRPVASGPELAADREREERGERGDEREREERGERGDEREREERGERGDEREPEARERDDGRGKERPEDQAERGSDRSEERGERASERETERPDQDEDHRGSEREQAGSDVERARETTARPRGVVPRARESDERKDEEQPAEEQQREADVKREDEERRGPEERARSREDADEVEERSRDERSSREGSPRKASTEQGPVPGERPSPTAVPTREGTRERRENAATAPGEDRRDDASQRGSPTQTRDPRSTRTPQATATPRPTSSESREKREESRERQERSRDDDDD